MTDAEDGAARHRWHTLQITGSQPHDDIGHHMMKDIGHHTGRQVIAVVGSVALADARGIDGQDKLTTAGHKRGHGIFTERLGYLEVEIGPADPATRPAQPQGWDSVNVA